MRLALTLRLTTFLAVLCRSFSQCVNDIGTIAQRESLVTDTSFPRSYTLCPNTDFEIGYLDFNNRVTSGQPMLPLQSNMRVQCGDDGSRSNGCRIRGGSVQVDGTDYFEFGPRLIKDVVLEGITFFNTSMHSAWLNQPGDIVFRDCEFRVRN